MSNENQNNPFQSGQPAPSLAEKLQSPPPRNSKKKLIIVLAILIAFFAYKKFASSPDSSTPPPEASAPATSTTPDSSVPVLKNVVVIETVHGKIKFQLFKEQAPKTVERFSQLVTQKFYDGLTFHRVEPGILIQGGDPQGTGMGGSGQSIPAEFGGEHKHISGAVGLARAEDPNSGDSQFYIMLRPLPSLDGSYTVFGQVTEGLEVAEKIQIGDKMTSVTLE